VVDGYRTSLNMRVIKYENLIIDAERMYKEFIDKHKESGRTVELIRSIDDLEF